MNSLFTLGHWAPSEQWEYALRLQLDPLAIGFLFMAALLALLLNGKPKEFLYPFLCVVGLVTLAMARDSLIFFSGWSGLTVLGLAYAPRLTKTDGHPLSSARWAPPLLAWGALLLAVVVSHSLFRQIDWLEMAKTSREPYDFPIDRLELTWGLCVFAAGMPLWVLSPAERAWSTIVAPLASALLLLRFGFLVDTVPHAARIASSVSFATSLAFSACAFFTPDPARAMRWVFPSAALFFTGLAPFLDSAEWSIAALLLCLSLVVFLREASLGVAGLLLFPVWSLFSASTYSIVAILAACAICALCFRQFIQRMPRPLAPRTALEVGLGLALIAAIPGASSVMRASFPWTLESDRTISLSVVLVTLGTLVVGCLIGALLERFHWDKEWGLNFPHQLPRALRAAWQFFDARFWLAIWWVPVQLARSLGAFFAFWQKGTTQYGLAVLLLATLFLFWAALKTQVLW